MNNQEAEVSTSESCIEITRCKYTTDDKQYPSGLDHVLYFTTYKGLNRNDVNSELYGRLL